jgi:phosphopantothenoylcysteine decarboxylase/phosphopantothenate--cysteine ligase
VASSPDQPSPLDLAGYELTVGVSGGIAAYKICTVVSRLVQRGCGVTVAMTDSATHFVTPLTFQTLTARPVFTSLWQTAPDTDQPHLRLTETADLLLVAPATADLIGKFASGIADDLVTTMMIGRDCPALLAPAMNTRMWQNPIVQRNIAALRELDYTFIEPAEGWLACRTIGQGRMAEPELIIQIVEQQLKKQPPRVKR